MGEVRLAAAAVSTGGSKVGLGVAAVPTGGSKVGLAVAAVLSVEDNNGTKSVGGLVGEKVGFRG